MTAFQGQPHWFRVYAGALADNMAVTGLLFSDLVVGYLLGGATTYTPKVLTSADWTELGVGSYFLRFTATELAHVNGLAFKATNAAIRPIIGNFDVDPAPLSFLASAQTCIVTGNVIDLAGRALSDQNQSLTISFRVSKVPQQVGGQSIISSRLITTTTDCFGNFSVALLRGAKVVMEADPLGLKQQFTVPDQSSATILACLPPF